MDATSRLELTEIALNSVTTEVEQCRASEVMKRMSEVEERSEECEGRAMNLSKSEALCH